jgi:hypothetical protein
MQWISVVADFSDVPMSSAVTSTLERLSPASVSHDR